MQLKVIIPIYILSHSQWERCLLWSDNWVVAVFDKVNYHHVDALTYPLPNGPLTYEGAGPPVQSVWGCNRCPIMNKASLWMKVGVASSSVLTL